MVHEENWRGLRRDDLAQQPFPFEEGLSSKIVPIQPEEIEGVEVLGRRRRSLLSTLMAERD